MEDFKEIILDLNNTTSNINVAIAELNKIELKLSPVIQSSISASIEKIRGDLLEVNKSSLDHSLLKCMQYCGDSLNYATDKIRELTIKQERSDVKLFFMLLGVCSLIGLLIGALFRLYAFK